MSTTASTAPLDSGTSSRPALRRALRARRSSLDPAAHRDAARALARLLCHSPLLRGRRHIAIYLPRDGEIDPLPTMVALSDRGVLPYLPVIEPLRGSRRLRFAPITDPGRMRRNRFGIPEPARQDARPGWSLDAVLLPLVGFDRQGGRLGMGGGFYDCTFDLRRARPARPVLIGLAHAVQEVDRLTLAAHDVPLAAIATDAELIIPGAGNRIDRAVHSAVQRIPGRTA